MGGQGKKEYEFRSNSQPGWAQLPRDYSLPVVNQGDHTDVHLNG